jgi:hypothetical protein
LQTGGGIIFHRKEDFPRRWEPGWGRAGLSRIARAGSLVAQRLRGPTKAIALGSGELMKLIAGWLSQEENFQWLDFGHD